VRDVRDALVKMQIISLVRWFVGAKHTTNFQEKTKSYSELKLNIPLKTSKGSEGRNIWSYQQG
jgi:hypothetical protein